MVALRPQRIGGIDDQPRPNKGERQRARGVELLVVNPHAERELHAKFMREVVKNEELWGKFGL